ncbi:MAG: DUF418 domain-containing protein [Gemmataceae bacterium]
MTNEPILAASLPSPPVALPPSQKQGDEAPVAPTERFGALDALRGFALLGILTMNVIAGMPEAAYFNPTVAGGFTGWNFVAWLVGYLVFNEKMMSIFSMLFGAGLILFSDRATVRGGSSTPIFLRRTVALLVFGLLHAYFLFYGDILYTYALCSLAVYWFRNLHPRTLLTLGVVMLLPGVVMMAAYGGFFRYARSAEARIEAARVAGTTPTPLDIQLAKAWQEARDDAQPSQAKIDEEIDLHRHGGYLATTRHRIKESLGMQTVIFATMLLWSCGGRMLIGMGLMKLGVWTGERSLAFYRNMAMFGYLLGLPLVAYGMYEQMRHDFDPVYMFGGDLVWNEFGSILVAFGHAGVLLGLWKAGKMPGVLNRLAAVGRMAFTNYLVQSLIMLLFFDGLGMFGRLDRVWLSLFVVAVWALQLAYSPVWLRYFRFGPAEWLWRTMTYQRWQPMLAK